MKLTTKILICTVAFLLISSSGLLFLYNKSKVEAKRQTENVQNLTKQYNQELTLTRAEFKKAETEWKTKVDSLLEANKIVLKKVKEITLIEVQYKDTGSVKIIYKDIAVNPDKTFIIPISYSDKCWGMEGRILTLDKNSKLEIDTRTANNSAQLLVTRKRFLGFLWWKKETDFKAYTDCGEITFTKIDFVK